MLNYSIQVGICWAIFLLLYYFLLRGETFFRLNRWYLLGTILLGLLIPSFDLIELNPSSNETEGLGYYLEPITVTVQQLEYTVEAITVMPDANESHAWPQWLLSLYVLGAILLCLRMIWGLIQIYRLYSLSEVEPRGAYELVKTPESHSPFSFFQWLFWSRSLQLPSEEEEYILRHELAHMHQLHSIDIILVEVLGIMFWFLPPIHYYKNALRNVHEYLADAAVYDTAPKKQYGQLLLKQAQSGQQPALAHPIFHSQLKQRIIMMTKNNSSRMALVKYLGLLPLAAFMLLAFSTSDFNPQPVSNDQAVAEILKTTDPFKPATVKQVFAGVLKKFAGQSDYEARQALFSSFEAQYNAFMQKYPEHSTEITQIAEKAIERNKVPILIKQRADATKIYFMETSSGKAYSMVDQMPRLPGCDGLAGEELEKCATKQLLVHIYTNVEYPKVAQEEGLEGTVVARFIIDEKGKLTEPEIVRSIGGGCDEEVLRVIGTLPDWVPGEHDGKLAKVEMKLPIKFKLAKEEDKVLEKADRMPMLPGCEDKACSNTKLINFLVENLKYPKDAKASGIEGVVVTKFIIDKEGNLLKPQTIRSIGYGCDEAVLEVIGKMKKELGLWTPGQLADGKKVSVYFTLPVSFRLESDERESLVDPVQALSLNNFKTFPNPADDQLNVQFDAEAVPTQIELTSLSGQQLIQTNLADFDGHYEGQLALDQVAPGTVLLTIRQGEKIFVQKVLIQR